MRKSTPAISLAMAWNAPPRTRRVTGSISTRSRVGGPGRRPTSYSITDISDLHCLGGVAGLGPGGGAGRDDYVAVAVDRRGEPRRDHRRRVVLVHDRGPLQAVAGLQGGAVVVPGRDLLQLSLHPEPRGSLVAQGILGGLFVSLLDLGVLEGRHETDPAHADVGDLDVGVLEAAGVLPLVDVVEVGAQLLGPGLVDLARADLDAQLVALAGVAGVDDALDDETVGRDPVVIEL